MSEIRPTRIVRPFAGRDHAFDVARLGTIEALERACNAGMGEIMGRLQGRQSISDLGVAVVPLFRHADIRETIRLGLMGGGMTEPEATQLVIDNLDGQPIAPQLGLAVAILTAYAYGVDDAQKHRPGRRAQRRRPSSKTTAG